MERITSKNNTLLKDTKKLLTSSRARAQSGLFVLEGARLCFDVLNSFYEVKSFIITEAAYERYKEQAALLEQKAQSSYLITDELAERLGETEHSQGVFAVCKMKAENAPLGSRVVALDRVQDPSNLGAIIRTAEALGIDSIILFGSCDIYNPKTLRASMGSVLRMNTVCVDDLEKTLGGLKDEYSIYSTVPDASAQKITETDFSKNTVCVIGNEANGVEENIKELSDALVTIPMLGNAESLNASVAAAITMWEMLR